MLKAAYTDNGHTTTVVLLHGIFGKKEQLRNFWDLPVNILAVDLPGHGKSESCPEKAVLECTQERLKETLTHYGVQDHILLGYSLGGFIVARLLAHEWGCKAAVVLSAGSRLPRTELVEEYRLLSHAKKTLPKHKKLVERLLDAFRSVRGENFSIKDEIDVSEAVAFLEALKNKNYARLLSQVQTPVLVVHGADDFVVPVAAGRTLQSHLPNSTFIELAKEGHLSVLRSKKVHDEVRRFITEHV